MSKINKLVIKGNTVLDISSRSIRVNGATIDVNDLNRYNDAMVDDSGIREMTPEERVEFDKDRSSPSRSTTSGVISVPKERPTVPERVVVPEFVESKGVWATEDEVFSLLWGEDYTRAGSGEQKFFYVDTYEYKGRTYTSACSYEIDRNGRMSLSSDITCLACGMNRANEKDLIDGIYRASDMRRSREILEV